MKEFGVKRRVAGDFDELIKKIQKAKVKNGTGDLSKRNTFSSRRITLAMTRHKAFQDFVVPDIIKADLK